jgi:superfamily II DNA or RNA helicase
MNPALKKIIDEGKLALLNSDFKKAKQDFANAQAAAEADNTLSDDNLAQLHYWSAIAQLGRLLQRMASSPSKTLAHWTKQLTTVSDALNTANHFNKNAPGIQYARGVIVPLLAGHVERLISDPASQPFFQAELHRFTLHYLSGLLIQQQLTDFQEKENQATSGLMKAFKRFTDSTQWIKELKRLTKSIKDPSLFLSKEEINKLYSIFETANGHDMKQEQLFRALCKHLFSPISAKADMSDLDEHLVWNSYRQLAQTNQMDHIIAIRSASLEDIEQLNEFIMTFKGETTSERLINDLSQVLTGQANRNECIRRISTLLTTSSRLSKASKEKIFTFLIQRFDFTGMPHDKVIYCQAELNKLIDTDNIDHSINRVMLHLDLFAVLPENTKEFIVSIKMIKQAKKALGETSFSQLLIAILNCKSLHNKLLSIMNASIDMGEKYFDELINLIHEYHGDWDTLNDKIANMASAAHYRKYPEKPLDVVMESFLQDPDVEFSLSREEVTSLKKQYLRMKKYGDAILQAEENNKNALSEALDDIKEKLRAADLSQKQQDTLKLKLLAIIRLFIKKHFHIFPYNTQMINVLALMNEPKRLAQIKTGEGKSTLIAMLAAVRALLGDTVDIITSARDLAERDAEKYKNFYQDLGLTVGCTKEKDHSSKQFEPSIVYGVVHDFEFAYIREEIGKPGTGRGKRPYQTVIVDEVDSMLIDMQRHEAILSDVIEEKFAKYGPNVYEAIWEWYTTHPKQEQTVENLIDTLESYGIAVDDDQAKRWLQSANNAEEAIDGKNYIIQDTKSKDGPQVKIVDYQNTGQVAQNSRWKNGMHAFVEAKNNLKIHPDNCTIGGINHIEYFRKYPTLMGVTGTLGSLTIRMILESLYGISHYDAPPYQPSQKQPLEHIVAKDIASQQKQALRVVKEMIKQGRPTLIICETIEESEALYEYFKKNNIDLLHLYNSMQEEKADNVITLAGTPGAVTIATNLAGRGTDIVPSKLAEENGGLHVMMTFPAINLRVERQAFGRTNRQGRKGTFHYVMRKDQLSDEAAQCKSIDKIFEVIQKERDADEMEFSLFSSRCFEFQHHLFNMQNLFFMLPKSIKFQNKDAWSQLREDLQHLSEKMMHQLTNLNDYNFELETDDQDLSSNTIYLKNAKGFVAYSIMTPTGEVQRHVPTTIPAVEPLCITDDLKFQILTATAAVKQTNLDLFSESYKTLKQMCQLFFEFWDTFIKPCQSDKTPCLETPYHFAREKKFKEIMALFNRYYPELQLQSAKRKSSSGADLMSSTVTFFKNLPDKVSFAGKKNLQQLARNVVGLFKAPTDRSSDENKEEEKAFSLQFSLHNWGKKFTK